ncbi:GTPase HflX [Candidatus Dependentiae bacterium]|nr:GTPase HflX [Candidatus Dependentiae bacterium]
MSKKPISTEKPHLKTLLVGVKAPYNKINPIEIYFEEFLNLIKTLGLKYEDKITIKLRSLDKANFFTKGKLQELKKYCDDNEIEEVVLSEILTPLQERNLEEILDCTVWDREKLILEIFRNAAHSAEGKIQVEMAEIEFLKTRLAGKGVELAQQEGIVGSKGPGETSKEVLKRHLAEKYRRAKKRLVSLKKSREIQRKKRLESNIPLICLVGYTNAGKSSLLNLLTKSHVEVENKLFATLDTTTRELFIDHQKIGLISDTVGFISQLPHHLVEAFKSTLDELQYANLLLHVVDISNPIWEDQIKIVNETLEELDVHKNILFVFNKTDKLNDQELKIAKEKTSKYQPNVFINTKSKENLKELINFLKNYKFSKET